MAQCALRFCKPVPLACFALAKILRRACAPPKPSYDRRIQGWRVTTRKSQELNLERVVKQFGTRPRPSIPPVGAIYWTKFWASCPPSWMQFVKSLLSSVKSLANCTTNLGATNELWWSHEIHESMTTWTRQSLEPSGTVPPFLLLQLRRPRLYWKC